MSCPPSWEGCVHHTVCVLWGENGGRFFPDLLIPLHGALERCFLLPSLCVPVPILPVSLPSRGPERPAGNEGAFGWLVGPDYVAQADLEFLPPSGVLELLVPGKQRDSGHEGQKFICGQSRKIPWIIPRTSSKDVTWEPIRSAVPPHSGPDQNLLSKISRRLRCMNFSKN